MEGICKGNRNFNKPTKRRQHESKVNYLKSFLVYVSTILGKMSGMRQRNKAKLERTREF